jgi:hypothetical protein
MADLIFVAVIIAFFGLLALAVRVLHPIVLAANTDASDQDQSLEDIEETV